MGSDTQTEDAPLCFAAALAEELKQVSELRNKKFHRQTERALLREQPSPEIVAMAVARPDSGPCADGPKLAAREAQRIFGEAHGMNLVGLAFSGGGIRSATFNLGILQGFADLGLLRIFDYISTVSGGGYIGSWLEAWILRAGQDEKKRADGEANPEPCEGVCRATPGIEVVERELKSERIQRDGTDRKHETGDDGNHETDEEHEAEAPGSTEPRPIRFLREYSNYLTPRRGVLGADTWAMVAIYLRNLLLNQTILVLFLFSLLLLPYLAACVTKWVSGWHAATTPYITPIAVMVLVTIALCMGAWNLRKPVEHKAIQESNGLSGFPRTQVWVLATVVAPLVLDAWILTGWIWCHSEIWKEFTLRNVCEWMGVGLAGFTVPWMISCLFAPKQDMKETDIELKYYKIWYAISSWFAGAIGGLLLFVIAHEIFSRLQPRFEGLWYEVSFGVPLTLIVFLLTAVLQMGFMGRAFSDPYREWWARVGAWIFLLILAWLTLSGLSFYAPLGLAWLGRWAVAAGGLVWVINTIIGVLGAKSSKTGALGSKTVRDSLLSLTPYVFIVGLVSLLSSALVLILARTYWALQHVGVQPEWSEFLSKSPAVATVTNWALNFSGTLNLPLLNVTGTAVSSNPATATPTYITAYWKIMGAATNWQVAAAIAISFLACIALSWRVDLNEFSMNLFYRNRLVRCYLGATRRDRSSNPFTGFDIKDDLLLAQLKSDCCYSGPFPIFNATLNLVNTRNLAWQERKAASFAMTPLRCGFDTWLERVSPHNDYRQGGRKFEEFDKYAYRPTKMYAYKDGGFYVGTAVGISGAALCPNMGYHSIPSLAMLMTFFNVRLGFWAGNPRDKQTWNRPGPKVGLWRLLAELFGLTDDNAKYVYLSDGGHFENLGVYELVKRRCKYIIACDAGADPDYTLGDLANAIRKCREDIGVEIELISPAVIPPAGEKKSAWHCVVGRIRYDMVDREVEEPGRDKDKFVGTLVYVKASLTGDEPPDVLNYQNAHPGFPHENTADQWFTESQFESYRRLGQHIVETMFPDVDASQKMEKVLAGHDPRGTLFKGLQDKWGPEKAQRLVERHVPGHRD